MTHLPRNSRNLKERGKGQPKPADISSNAWEDGTKPKKNHENDEFEQQGARAFLFPASSRPLWNALFKSTSSQTLIAAAVRNFASDFAKIANATLPLRCDADICHCYSEECVTPTAGVM
jgi:hypothetical protein